jgi:hypothetical protein
VIPSSIFPGVHGSNSDNNVGLKLPLWEHS